jgi:hypothetical protein
VFYKVDGVMNVAGRQLSIIVLVGIVIILFVVTFFTRFVDGWRAPELEDREVDNVVELEDGADYYAEYPEALFDDGDETVFDGCGSLEKYAALSFYPDFVRQVSLLPVSSQVDYEDELFYTLDSVGDACFAEEEGLFVVLLRSNRFCDLGTVVQYRVYEGVLLVADTQQVYSTLASSCLPALDEFGKRRGLIIDVSGFFGDAGYSASYGFEYYYHKNILTVVSACSVLENAETGEVLDEMCVTY